VFYSKAVPTFLFLSAVCLLLVSGRYFRRQHINAAINMRHSGAGLLGCVPLLRNAQPVY